MDILIKQGALDRWWIHLADEPSMGWSGSRWVPCDPVCGVPTGGVQVCNFSTKEEAEQYAKERGLM